MQGMQTLSDTEDALEEVYMDALEQLQNKRQEEKGAYRNQQREMEEYYALWVHQIKTPISAMRLLLQREEQKQTEDETVGMEKVCCMTCSRNYSGLTSMSIWHFSTSG